MIVETIPEECSVLATAVLFPRAGVTVDNGSLVGTVAVSVSGELTDIFRV